MRKPSTYKVNAPLISVVIIAYNRKEFITEAINSVLNQNLKREKFEIIVIKNFVDEKIDEFIRNKGIRLVNSPDISISGKIIQGVKLSHAEVVSFMEDDDLFLPNKLEHVFEKFSSNPRIIFMHNNLTALKDGITFQRKLGQDVLVNTESVSVKTISKLIDLGLAQNISSFSVRRERLMPILEYLDGTSLAVDYLLFFISCLPDGELLLSDEILTIWRIHESATHFKVKDRLEYVARKMDHISKLVGDFNSFATHIKSGPLKSYIEINLSMLRVQQFLFSKDIDISVRDFFNSLKFAFSKYSLKKKTMIIIGTFLMIPFNIITSKASNIIYLMARAGIV